MRTEQEMMALILQVAREDDRIRAVFMNGSRANPKVQKDPYQDYDIVYVVTETGSFLNDRTWLKVFGEPLIVQEPDNNDFGWGINADFSRSYAWLMLFKDGNRMDLTLVTLETLPERYLEDSLTVPLLDKDNCLPEIPPSNDSNYWVKKPQQPQYRGCCNEFWWCLNNVAKGIVRDQLPYTMWMYHVIVRPMLDKMLDWYIGINTDFSVSVGMQGKYYKKYLPPELYQMYARTYSDSNYDNLWDAIFTACRLFRTVAQPVADALGFTYNLEEDTNMLAYLSRMRAVSNAKE
jgi:aminoglycoside 6-adenylyltransferase